MPLAGAHFYLTGVRDAKGNELMYFEIPLEKYLSAPPVRNSDTDWTAICSVAGGLYNPLIMATTPDISVATRAKV